MGPLSKRTGILLREETQRWRRRERIPFGEQREAAASQRPPRTAGRHQKLGKGKEFTQFQRRHDPADNFISDF